MDKEKFVFEEDDPTEDEIRAFQESDADTSPTIPQEEIDWE